MILYLIAFSQMLKTEIANQLRHSPVWLDFNAHLFCLWKSISILQVFLFAGDLAHTKVINAFITILVNIAVSEPFETSGVQFG